MKGKTSAEAQTLIGLIRPVQVCGPCIVYPFGSTLVRFVQHNSTRQNSNK